MAGVSLEPTGAHETPSGLVRYAIWEWRDADGVRRLPCGLVAALAATRFSKAMMCGGPRPFLKTDSRSMRRVARSLDLIDDDNRLTERGAAVRLMFLRRDGVLARWETAHGETVPY